MYETLVVVGICRFWRLKKFIGVVDHVLLFSYTQVRGTPCIYKKRSFSRMTYCYFRNAMFSLYIYSNKFTKPNGPQVDPSIKK